jgi:hypothetical protein
MTHAGGPRNVISLPKEIAMRTLKLLGSLVLLLAAVFCGPAAAAPETGWWWNASENGRGFFVESHDGTFFLGGYFYNDDGHATWLVAGGANADPYHYTGPLLAESGGQTLFGMYTPPSRSDNVGPVTVAFSDDTHGTITWPGGTIPIVRYAFGTGVADFQPFTGWWWNPAESGSGYSVEVQGDSIFIIGYMYDVGGRPVWYLSAGKMSSPSTYSGPLLQFAGGQTMTGPYHPPSTTPVTVGTLDVEFIAQDEANFTFSDGAAAAVSGTSPGGARRILAGGHFRMIRVVPTFPHCTPSLTTFPSRYDGNFTETTTIHDTSNPFLDVQEKITITGNLTFSHVGPAPSTDKDACGNPVVTHLYVVTDGQITVKYDYASSPAVPPGPSCTQSNPGKIFSAQPASITSGIQLKVTSYSKYILDLNTSEGALPLEVTGQCVYPGGTTLPLDPEVLTNIIIDTGINEGANVYGFHGGGTRTIGERSSTYHWDFAAVRP